jgi:hypothetical protein
MPLLKRILLYVLYISVILCTLYYGLQYQFHLLEEAKETFTLPGTLHWYSTAFSIFIGVLFAIPTLFYNLSQNGNWTYDWIRGVLVGIPSLFITLLPILYWSIPDYIQFLPTQLFYFVGATDILPTATGMLFGYTLLSRLRKVSD